MILKTIKGAFDSPRRSYVIESDNYMREEGMINEKQRQTLTNLIYSKVSDSDECERRISQMEDMTYAEAEEEIFSFLSSSWR